ncbi:MAG: tyrosine-type recombinase/integrase [Candidatus Omnitrophota bacterium]
MEEHSFITLKREFIEYLRMHNYSEGTITRHGYCVDDFYEYLSLYTQIARLDQIDKHTVQDYQKYLYHRPKKTDPSKKMHPSTQYKMITTLNTFFKFLVKQSVILVNPCQDIELPKQEKALPKAILSKPEINRLLLVPDTTTTLGYRDRTLLEVLYSTGLRVNEVRNLTIYDINYNEGLVKVTKTKGKRDRVVPLGKIASEYVRDYIQNIRPKLTKPKSGTLLFLNRRGGKFSKTGINVLVKRYAKKAKIKKHITTHCLRHTCATLMLKGHADIRHIQEMLGHKSIESTQVYTRVLPLDLKRVHQRTHPREKEAKQRLFHHKKALTN